MSTASIVFFDCATAAFSLASIFINSFTVINIVYRKKANKRQYEMLLSLIVFHMIFNLSSVFYSTFKTLNSQVTVTLWSQTFMRAASVAIVCGNTCVVVDRLLAINQPVVYGQRHKKRWLTFSFCFLVTVFSLCFGAYVYAVNKKIVDYIATPIYILKCAASAINVLITVEFLRKLRVFLRSRENFPDIVNLRTANQVVIYETIAEIIINIIPTIVTTVLNEIYQQTITNTVGSYPNALFALKTTVCALCLAVKLKSSNVVRITQSKDRKPRNCAGSVAK